MAAVQSMPSTALKQPGYTPIISPPAKSAPQPTTFDAAKHLSYSPPESVIKMADLGFPEGTGVSPVAVSQPFRLFSREAVEAMRTEIFNPEIMAHCSFRSNIAACQLRGYAEKYAPFTYAAWRHPSTLRLLSSIAGIDLVPEMDYEIGHINFSVKTAAQTAAEKSEIEKQKQMFAYDEGIAGCPWEDDKPIVGWHTDSYPFVCVLMLSDCTDMIGGDTALRTADGQVIKVRGPDMGCAVVLQGRYITHQALRALGARERITSVTSFRPRNPLVADDTELRTVRPVSDLSELYYQFGEYRLQMLEERIREKLWEIKAHRRGGGRFKTMDFKAFLAAQIAFLERTEKEIVRDEDVRMGYTDTMDIPDVKVRM